MLISARQIRIGGMRLPARQAITCLILMALTCLAPPVSLAHQQKAAVTRVLFNERSGNLEVMHRFNLHDAEHAATILFAENSRGLAESVESRELFASYVVNRFAVQVLRSEGAEDLTLGYVGSEVDGMFLWVYQEAPVPRQALGLSFIHLALRDLWPDQTNLVNVRHGDEILSLTFSGNAEELSVHFP